MKDAEFNQAGMGATEGQKLSWSSPSALVLIAANLVPLAGVVWLGWSIEEVMLLFWLESAVIGLFNLVKLWVIASWQALPVGVFFVVHYGGFMTGHLVFLVAFLGEGDDIGFPDAAYVLGLFVVFWPAVVAMLVSHGFSFLSNFLGQQEYLHKTLPQQMMEPYARIMVMHATILLGGFMVFTIGAPLPALLLLIVLKTGIDLASHLREHRRAAARNAALAG